MEDNDVDQQNDHINPENNENEQMPNNLQIEQPQRNALLENLSSQEKISITSSFFPSISFLVGSIIAASYSQELCSKEYGILLKIMINYFSFAVVKDLLRVGLWWINIDQWNKVKYTRITVNILFEFLYFGCVLTGYIFYLNRSPVCFNQNLFLSILIFCFIWIGIIHWSSYLLKGLLICICFPILVGFFIRNPNSFYANFGIDPEIVNNLPTIPAKLEHCKDCVICSEEIKFGDQILVLKCPGKHFFHGSCIKSWLKVKVMCPMCRSEIIL